MTTTVGPAGTAPAPPAPPQRSSGRAQVLRTWALRLVLLGALVVGLVALAVGVGLGPRHAAKEGLGTTAMLGLALAAAGALAVVWAAVRILRAVRRRWWAALVPLLLVATYLTLWDDRVVGFLDEALAGARR
jgi:hypothetical protein